MTAETMGPGEVGPGRGGRMSRQRKTAAVLRLLRGEDLEAVSRALGITAATLSGWRAAFLAAGEAALATRPGSGEELASERLKAKLGDALIERDLLREKIALLEAGRPLASGSRGDEPGSLAGQRQAPRLGRGLPRLGPRALDRLPAPGAAASERPTTAGAGRTDAGC